MFDTIHLADTALPRPKDAVRNPFRRRLMQHYPKDYEWVPVWPTKSPLQWQSTGVGCLIGAFITAAMHVLSIPASLTITFIGTSLIAGSRQWGRVNVREIANDRTCIYPSIVNNPNVQGMLGIMLAGGAAIWAGASKAVPGWFIPCGAIFIIISVPTIGLYVNGRYRNYLVFDNDGLRVVRNFRRLQIDRRYPWAAISGVQLTPDGRSNRPPTPYLTFTCPDEAVTEHSHPDHHDYWRDGPGQWRLPVRWWNVEPNAFYATLRYLTTHSDDAESITHHEIRAMLTPPNRRQRRWATRQLQHRLPPPAPDGHADSADVHR